MNTGHLAAVDLNRETDRLAQTPPVIPSPVPNSQSFEPVLSRPPISLFSPDLGWNNDNFPKITNSQTPSQDETKLSERLSNEGKTVADSRLTFPDLSSPGFAIFRSEPGISLPGPECTEQLTIEGQTYTEDTTEEIGIGNQSFSESSAQASVPDDSTLSSGIVNTLVPTTPDLESIFKSGSTSSAEFSRGFSHSGSSNNARTSNFSMSAIPAASVPMEAESKTKPRQIDERVVKKTSDDAKKAQDEKQSGNEFQKLHFNKVRFVLRKNQLLVFFKGEEHSLNQIDDYSTILNDISNLLAPVINGNPDFTETIRQRVSSEDGRSIHVVASHSSIFQNLIMVMPKYATTEELRSQEFAEINKIFLKRYIETAYQHISFAEKPDKKLKFLRETVFTTRRDGYVEAVLKLIGNEDLAFENKVKKVFEYTRPFHFILGAKITHEKAFLHALEVRDKACKNYAKSNNSLKLLNPSSAVMDSKKDAASATPHGQQASQSSNNSSHSHNGVASMEMGETAIVKTEITTRGWVPEKSNSNSNSHPVKDSKANEPMHAANASSDIVPALFDQSSSAAMDISSKEAKKEKRKRNDDESQTGMSNSNSNGGFSKPLGSDSTQLLTRISVASSSKIAKTKANDNSEEEPSWSNRLRVPKVTPNYHPSDSADDDKDDDYDDKESPSKRLRLTK